MKSKSNQSIKCDKGITLIALIITIILLVILAAITIKAVYNMNIVGIASDAVIDYAIEQNKETNTLDDIAKIIGQITGDDLTLLKPTVTLRGTKGNGNVYSSGVTITIKDSFDIATMGKIEIHYAIEGLNEGREETVQGRETEVVVTEEGIYKIRAWMQDGKGNKSEIEEIEFIIDKSKPGEPRISFTGTEGDNEYYIDEKVGVTIEAGSNITSGVSAIKYRVEGANPVAETTEYTDTVNFDIPTDGESTIYAKIISNSGVVSDEIDRVLKKDSKEPNVATITYNTCDTATITVTANGQDATSKVKSYIFEKSIDNVKFDPVEEVTSGDESIAYVYKGLKDGQKYYLRVTVKDNAGLTKPSNVIEQTTVLANQAPTKAQVAYNTKGTNYIKVNAKATDPDNDQLTYILRYGTDQSNLNLSTELKNQTPNVEVPIQTATISSYTYYYWRVDVTDGKITTEGDVQTRVRTYCPGTGYTCYGPFVETNGKACTASGCNGGKITSACTGKVSTNDSRNAAGTKCGNCGLEGYVETFNLVCSVCGYYSGRYSDCTYCGTSYMPTGMEIQSDGYYNCTKSITFDCTICGGDGKVDRAIPCTAHGLYSQHSYCSHGRVGQHDN